MGLSSLADGIKGMVTTNPLASLAGAAVVGTAVGVGSSAIVGAVRKRKTKRRKSKTARKRSSTSKRRKSMRRTPRTAGKRRDRSSKRIRYTKNGQPYVILRNGRARFISKKSAKESRKRKGGRY